MDFIHQFIKEPIKYSIPIFFILIGIELLVARLKKEHLYRFNDAIANLSCGIGSQVSGIFLKVLTFYAYVWLYENHSPFKGQIPTTWWSVVALFIGVDFFYYWFHRLAHEIAVMWGSHVVHHQSEEYNLTVALRQAWLQGAFSWLFYLPLAFLGFQPVVFASIAGFQTLYQFWIHTKTINKLPAPFEYVFNTPSHHRVHHGVNPKYIDRNHGGTLIIFDRMFGTFQAEEEEVVYGITKQTNSWNPLWVNFEYWIDLFKNALKASRWKDKFKILFKPPGWYPDELGGVQQPHEVSAATFRKYDEKAPRGLNLYVFLHYIIVLAGTTYFLFAIKGLRVKEFEPWHFVFVALIIVSLVSLGAMFERKRWVPVFEFLRLLFIAGALIYFLQGSANLLPVVAVTTVIAAGSILWISRFRNSFTSQSF